MGWDFTKDATKKDIIADILKRGAAVAHTVKGNILWTVEGPETKRLIGCYILGSDKGFGWGSKDMCEGMHPFYYSCPLSYLDLAPVACEEWREKVKSYHARAKLTLKVGDKVKLVEGCSIPEVTVTSVKPLLAVGPGGKTYKLPRRYIDSVVGS